MNSLQPRPYIYNRLPQPIRACLARSDWLPLGFRSRFRRQLKTAVVYTSSSETDGLASANAVQAHRNRSAPDAVENAGHPDTVPVSFRGVPLIWDCRLQSYPRLLPMMMKSPRWFRVVRCRTRSSSIWSLATFPVLRLCSVPATIALNQL